MLCLLKTPENLGFLLFSKGGKWNIDQKWVNLYGKMVAGNVIDVINTLSLGYIGFNLIGAKLLMVKLLNCPKQGLIHSD